jgi:membrane protein implicated in regulation of membrane protease activity
MCHLLLALPILALPVFWLLPLSVAVPIYALVAAVSVVVYAGLVKVMRNPVKTGKEHMLGATGEVVSNTGARLTVRIDGELWTAESTQANLRIGDTVRVVAVVGLHLSVAMTSAEDENV